MSLTDQDSIDEREPRQPYVDLMDAQTHESALFTAECHLHAALRNLHEAERQLEWLAENGHAVEAEGFGACVSLLSKLHGRIRRVQMAQRYPGVSRHA